MASYVTLSLSNVCPAKTSGYQQNLPDTTLFRSGLTRACVTDRKLPADRNHQFAISDGCGHELESLRIGCREYRHHPYRWVFFGVLRCPENRRKHSSRLDLGNQFLGGFAADRIGNGIEQGKIRNRVVVVGREYLGPPHSFCFFPPPLQDPRNYHPPPLFPRQHPPPPPPSSAPPPPHPL